jgi:ATP-dependent protease ClpP protease subunit
MSTFNPSLKNPGGSSHSAGGLLSQIPKVPDTVYVSFSAEIVPHTTESLIGLLSEQVNKGVKNVYLILSTPGGSVMHGMNLYNVLRGMPFHLTTHNVGNVDSIGNAVFLAGATRYACKHSTFMFHGVGIDVPAQFRLEEKILKERLESILSDQRRIGSIIEDRTKIEKAAIAELFREAQTKDADFAVGCGIVNEIRDVKIPPGGPVYSLVFQR